MRSLRTAVQFALGLGDREAVAHLVYAIVDAKTGGLFRSDDSGTTWSNERRVSLGRQGEYQRRSRITSCGTSRNRQWRITVTDPVPVILVGDLNSDVKTAIKPGDGAADWWLLKHGMTERSTRDPLSCCLNADVLTANGGGKRSDFDHIVDHIMTSSPKKVKNVGGAVTGLKPFGGFWDSDHAGLFSKLVVG